MNNDPDCDRPQAHECPGPGCTYPLRAPRTAERVSSVEDLAFRLASHAMAFALITDDQFARFREYVIRAEISQGSPQSAEILKEGLDQNLLNESHLALLLAIQRIDPARYH
jgi:hypothetical protein